MRDDGRRERRRGNEKGKGCGCVGSILLLLSIFAVFSAIQQCGEPTKELEEKETQTFADPKEKEPESASSSPSKPELGRPKAAPSKSSIEKTPLSQKPQVRTNQRTWTDSKGRELEAALIRLFKTDGVFHGDFERPDGSVFTYKIGNLSEDDINLVKGLLKESE